MGFRLPWEADAAPAYDGPITLTPDGGPFLYNDAVPYEMLLAAGVIIPSWLVVYAVMHALLEVKLYDAKKGLIKAPTLAERIDAADGVWCFFFFFVLVGLAFYSTWQLAFTDDSRDRWLGTTAASEAFQIVYVTRMVTHLPVQHYSLSNNPTLRLQMHGHHIITMVAMSGGVLSGRFHFFACLGGCCECAWLRRACASAAPRVSSAAAHAPRSARARSHDALPQLPLPPQNARARREVRGGEGGVGAAAVGGLRRLPPPPLPCLALRLLRRPDGEQRAADGRGRDVVRALLLPGDDDLPPRPLVALDGAAHQGPHQGAQEGDEEGLAKGFVGFGV